ncbi:MAG: DUF4426 domain-containing protein [Gammaproteobacteria bacterium]
MDGVQAPLPVLAFLLALLGGCGTAESPPPAALPYPDPGFVEAGNVRLHYALTPTQDLPVEIAGSYGIVQRRNLALLTIAFSARTASGGTQPDAGPPAATAIALTGRRQPLALARRDLAAGPTWLATLEFRDREPITIEIEARAAAGQPLLAARFTRAFPVD